MAVAMIECNLGKIQQTHTPKCPKNTYPEFFAFNNIMD